MPPPLFSGRRFIAGSIVASTVSGSAFAAETDHPDICVYGGTASGVMAGVAAAKEGCTVVIVEPGRWLGGMTGGGLSHVDWGREKAVGGTALSILSKNHDDAKYREVFRELVKKYGIRVIDEHRVASGAEGRPEHTRHRPRSCSAGCIRLPGGHPGEDERADHHRTGFHRLLL